MPCCTGAKLILDGPGAADGGRCASAQYAQCELVAKNGAQQDRCPHLEEIRVQYCGVSPVTKLVPFSDSELSSCTSNTYRYCDSYLLLARPHATTPPAHLLYTPNHFWLDAEESGLCHIGIDGFLADVAGSVDGITFVTVHGTHCPALALTIHGVEWPMSFPNPLMIQKVNSRVRSDPARLTADPYGAGWLFEGWELPGRTRAGLVSGPQAAAWQAAGARAADARNPRDACARLLMAARRCAGVAQLLSRQHLVCLFQHFFSNKRLDGGGMMMARNALVFGLGLGRRAGGGVGCVSARALRAAAAAARVSPQDACGKIWRRGLQRMPRFARGRNFCRNSCHGEMRRLPLRTDRREQSRSDAGRQLHQARTRDSVAGVCAAAGQCLVFACDPCEARGLGLHGMSFDVRRVGPGASLSK